MGQYFFLFNIDKRQNVRQMALKYGDIWDNPGMVTDIIFNLARGPGSVAIPQNPFTHLEPRKKTSMNNNAPSKITGFHSVPTEVHALIFEYLEAYYDAYALSLTNSYLWATGFTRLCELFTSVARQQQRQWAGDRIILIGDYADDIPDNVFTEEELSHLDVNNKANLFTRMVEWTRNVSLHPSTTEFQLGGSSFTGTAEHRKMRNRYESLRYWDNPMYAEIRWDIKEGFPYVLRNLTRKVYVRADELALDPKDVDGFKIQRLDFGHLIFSKIAWSSDPSLSMRHSGHLHRGEWAGDRFDIVRLDELKLEGWKNISKQAQKELLQVWKGEYGDDWLSWIRRW